MTTLQRSSFHLFHFDYVIFVFFGGLLFGTALNPYLITNVGLLFFMLLAVYLISRYKISLPHNPINRLFLVFILFDMLHLFIAVHFISLNEAYKVAIILSCYVGVYVIVQSYTSDLKNLHHLNIIFAVLFGGEAVLAILQHFSDNFYLTNPNVGDETTRIVKGYDIFSYFNSRFAQDFFEARGTFGQKNQLGAFLLLFAPYFMCLSAYFHRQKKRLLATFYLMTTLLVIIALYYSYSRSAWLGFAVALPVLASMAMKGRTKFILSFVLAGITLVILINNSVLNIAYDYIFSTDSTLYSRLPFWQTTVNHINDSLYHFFMGYSFVNPYIVDSFYNEFSWTPLGHNSYLTIWEAKGLIGLIIVLALLIVTLKKLKLVWHEAGDPMISAMALGLFIGLLGFMVSQLFDHKLFLYSIEINIFLVVVISLTLSFTRFLKKTE